MMLITNEDLKKKVSELTPYQKKCLSQIIAKETGMENKIISIIENMTLKDIKEKVALNLQIISLNEIK